MVSDRDRTNDGNRTPDDDRGTDTNEERIRSGAGDDVRGIADDEDEDFEDADDLDEDDDNEGSF